MDLKKKGIVRPVGLSTHHVDLANKVLDMGILDVLMFSINPAYDYDRGEYSDGGAKKRMELYRRCEKEGVGITVMKAFGGGKLLSDDLLPFKKALTRMPCIAYALDKLFFQDAAVCRMSKTCWLIWMLMRKNVTTA